MTNQDIWSIWLEDETFQFQHCSYLDFLLAALSALFLKAILSHDPKSNLRLFNKSATATSLCHRRSRQWSGRWPWPPSTPSAPRASIGPLLDPSSSQPFVSLELFLLQCITSSHWCKFTGPQLFTWKGYGSWDTLSLDVQTLWVLWTPNKRSLSKMPL